MVGQLTPDLWALLLLDSMVAAAIVGAVTGLAGSSLSRWAAEAGAVVSARWWLWRFRRRYSPAVRGVAR